MFKDLVLSSLFFFFITLFGQAFAKEKIINLSQRIEFKIGESFRLYNSDFSVTIDHFSGSVCAVPGKNCGSGYRPPSPIYKINCSGKNPCPYVLMTFPKDDKSGLFSIEDQDSCEKNNPEICFFEFAKLFIDDSGCASLKSAIGRYYCLKRFPNSVREENKNICDQLPESIFALRWNCFYEYAIRYRDPAFCDKYPLKNINGKDRCLLKIAEILKNKSYCRKISSSKDHTYKEQCLKKFGLQDYRKR